MANKTKEKKSTEVALELYPALQEMVSNNGEVPPHVMTEALYLLMQMIGGPSLAGRIISCAQVQQ